MGYIGKKSLYTIGSTISVEEALIHDGHTRGRRHGKAAQEALSIHNYFSICWFTLCQSTLVKQVKQQKAKQR